MDRSLKAIKRRGEHASLYDLTNIQEPHADRAGQHSKRPRLVQSQSDSQDEFLTPYHVKKIKSDVISQTDEVRQSKRLVPRFPISSPTFLDY